MLPARNDGCWPGAMSGLRNVSIRTYFADDSGFDSATRSLSGKPVHGTTIDHASTQRWR
jgi:hypothetical protein